MFRQVGGLYTLLFGGVTALSGSNGRVMVCDAKLKRLWTEVVVICSSALPQNSARGLREPQGNSYCRGTLRGMIPTASSAPGARRIVLA